MGSRCQFLEERVSKIGLVVMKAGLSLQTVNNQFLERELKDLHTAALTSSLRARQRGLETTPEDGMAWSALNVCKEVQTDSERFLKASSEEEEAIRMKSVKTKAFLLVYMLAS